MKEIVIDGPYYNYGKNYECNSCDRKIKFCLSSKTSQEIDLNEIQQKALIQSVSKIIDDLDVVIERGCVIIPKNDYNKKHIETVKETILQTLSLL